MSFCTRCSWAAHIGFTDPGIPLQSRTKNPDFEEVFYFEPLSENMKWFMCCTCCCWSSMVHVYVLLSVQYYAAVRVAPKQYRMC